METDIGRLSPALLLSIEGKKRELDRLRPFPPAVIRRLEEEFRLEWTFNSNAIEGNTLNLRETDLVVSRGLTIGRKTLREHFEAINHAAAVTTLEEFVKRKAAMGEEPILKLHDLILKNIDDGERGRYRRTNVRIVGAVHIPPQAMKVPKLMGELMDWYHTNEHALPAPELAAWLHYRLVNIHPFTDGNGRTARLAMNLVLMRSGYPPAVILNVDRKKYYRVLKEADSGRPQAFMDFTGRAIERSLMIYLNALKTDGATERHGYIPLADAARLCSYGIEYLSFLARTGRLPAVKIGSRWMTTEESVREYMEKMR